MFARSPEKTRNLVTHVFPPFGVEKFDTRVENDDCHATIDGHPDRSQNPKGFDEGNRQRLWYRRQIKTNNHRSFETDKK